jgi:hypothetical protein
LEGAVDQLGAGVIGGGEIGDDDADVALLAGGRDEVGKGAGGNVGDGPIATFCVSR